NGNAVLKSNTWEFRQVIDIFDITAMADENTICRITASEHEAIHADPIDNPVCLFEWTQIPPESMPKAPENKSDKSSLPGLEGHAVDLGEQEIKYELFIFNGQGEKVFLSEGTQT